MGLCKCPKKKITNQFCYEHRVNVCEYCMVTSHQKCIVQSYMLWLRDQDYRPVCTLCSGNLAEGDCVRLVCYHMFHWACLDKYARDLPATTAPAGYICPTCKKCILPKDVLFSPVGDVLREKLAGVNWARAGFGLPLLSDDKEQRPKPIVQTSTAYQNHVSASVPTVAMSRTSSNVNSISSNMNNIQHNSQKIGPPYSVVNMESSLAMSNQMSRNAREAYDDSKNVTFDHDENKYQRKSAIIRWWNLIVSPQPQRGSNNICLYKNAMIMLGFFSLLGLLLSWL